MRSLAVSLANRLLHRGILGLTRVFKQLVDNLFWWYLVLKLVAVWNDSTRCLGLNLVVTCNVGELVRDDTDSESVSSRGGVGGRWINRSQQDSTL